MIQSGDEKIWNGNNHFAQLCPEIEKVFSQMNEINFLISFLNWGLFVKSNFCLICQRIFFHFARMKIENKLEKVNYCQQINSCWDRWLTLPGNTPGKIWWVYSWHWKTWKKVRHFQRCETWSVKKITFSRRYSDAVNCCLKQKSCHWWTIIACKVCTLNSASIPSKGRFQ